MIDLKSSIKPVLPLCVWNWIFGIGVIEYPIGNRRPKLSLVYALLILAIYIATATIAYPCIDEYIAKFKIGISVKVLFFSQILTTFSTITLGWCRSELLHKCLISSSVADTMMASIGIQRDYAKLMRIQIRKAIAGSALLLVITTTSTFLVTINVPSAKVKALSSFVMSLPVFLSYVADASFVNIIKKIHIQLIKICQDVDTAYGLQVMLSIIVASSVITVHVYVIYALLVDNDLPRKVTCSLMTAGIMWITYYTVKISCFSSICSCCVQQAIKTGDVINELYDDPSSSDECKFEIRNFNVQMLQNPLKFTACGFINLDFTLVQMMISTITTYSMIIIQLGKLPSITSGHSNELYNSKKSVFQTL